MSEALLPVPSASRRASLAVWTVIAIAALAGWGWLAALVATMLPTADMSQLGPGMAVLNQFNLFRDLPPEIRASLSVICLPGSGLFGMPGEGRWGLAELAMVLVMWEAMVLAMMLPSAAPVLAGEAARAGRPGGAVVTSLVLGYLAIWTAFALAATGLQWALTAVRALTPAMAPASLILAGTTLLAVGLYQFTPLKLGCLNRCRAPAPLLLDPERGALHWFRAGLRAGQDCLGCCWALMLAMFAVGVMNVIWVAVLGLVMVAEKRSTGLLVPRLIGIVLFAWGAALILASPQGRHLAGLG